MVHLELPAPRTRHHGAGLIPGGETFVTASSDAGRGGVGALGTL